jgi:hypothetical protein
MIFPRLLTECKGTVQFVRVALPSLADWNRRWLLGVAPLGLGGLPS